MAEIKIPESMLEKCFNQVLNEYGLEDIGTLAEIIYKAEKYAWHDLRKNPDDLPTDKNKHYLYWDGFMEELRMATGWWLMQQEPNDYFVAWREIEPFESEE